MSSRIGEMTKDFLVNRDKIDILRAVAIIAVILIHTFSNVFRFYEPHSASWFQLLFADEVVRFSVPMFVALSGFTLAYKYREQTRIPLKDFFLRRLFKIIPLYLFWGTVIYFYLQNFGYYSGEGEGYPFWQAILLGRADYHLYFVPMLFQLYVLFPVLFYLITRFKLKVLIPMLIFQAITYLYIGTHVEKNIIDPSWTDQTTYRLFGVWIFYFCLGIYLSRVSIKTTALKYILILLTILSLDWLTEKAIMQVKTSIDIIVVTRFSQIPVLFYASSLITFFIIWGNRLTQIPNIVRQVLVIMGRDSYTVYLLHTIVIRLLFSVWQIPGYDNVFILSGATILISFVSARIFNLGIKKFVPSLA